MDRRVERANITFQIDMLDKAVIDKIGKKGMKVILLYLMVTRKVICNAFYKEEASISNKEVLRVCCDNVNLMHLFRKENKVFLNRPYNDELIVKKRRKGFLDKKKKELLF